MNEEMEAEMTKWIQYLTIWQTQNIKGLIKLYQFILENKERQNHTKRK